MYKSSQNIEYIKYLTYLRHLIRSTTKMCFFFRKDLFSFMRAQHFLEYHEVSWVAPSWKMNIYNPPTLIGPMKLIASYIHFKLDTQCRTHFSRKWTVNHFQFINNLYNIICQLFQEIIRVTELSWLLARVGILVRKNWLK